MDNNQRMLILVNKGYTASYLVMVHTALAHLGSSGSLISHFYSKLTSKPLVCDTRVSMLVLTDMSTPGS